MKTTINVTVRDFDPTKDLPKRPIIDMQPLRNAINSGVFNNTEGDGWHNEEQAFRLGAESVYQKFKQRDKCSTVRDKRDNETDSQYIDMLRDQLMTCQMSNRGWLESFTFKPGE